MAIVLDTKELHSVEWNHGLNLKQNHVKYFEEKDKAEKFAKDLTKIKTIKLVKIHKFPVNRDY